MADIEVIVQPAASLAVTVQPAATIVVDLSVGQGPAGTGTASAAPVAVNTSRAVASSDSGRVLQCASGVTLTVPAGLPAALAAQLLMNATQVLAGGQLSITPDTGVTVNGMSSVRWDIERLSGSTVPWMAWLQHETGSDAYSLVVVGATLTAVSIGGAEVYETGIYEAGVYA